MKLKVFYDRENKEKTIELDGNMSVKDLLEKMNINPITVIVSKNDNIILEDEKLNDKDDIKIISVISGG
ncbi:thiamine biosynthesis protein ThiS [Candidatus Woesearchaeota archaeon]|nr:thiamine biosynthesis protein ThiS [Candidatus Woesearchaeota archaeon]|tara:strand:- start:1181 stop:1387 length:207 start_codon:yes stop_codon:yes gene_type:complete